MIISPGGGSAGCAGYVVGGWVFRSDYIANLSQAGAGAWAELGKKDGKNHPPSTPVVQIFNYIFDFENIYHYQVFFSSTHIREIMVSRKIQLKAYILHLKA